MTPDDEELLTASELARAAGVSASTIANWTSRADRPLQTVTTADGAIRYTWSQLQEFCSAHSKLQAARRIRRRALSGLQLKPEEASAVQLEELKSLTRDLRTAVHEVLQAAIEAARQNEEAARSHRLQLERFATAFAAYDAGLGQATAPSTLND